MIAYFLLGLGVLIGFILLGRAFATARPAALARGVRSGGAGALGVAALVLLATGRFMLGLPLAFLAYGLWQRTRMPSFPFGQSQASTGKTSEVTTELVHMVLEHASGAMRGTVRAGRFAGRDLGAMTLPELRELLADCQRDDQQAVALLETFIERAFGQDWRVDESAAEAAGRQRAGAEPKGGMPRAEALSILGLAEGASATDVKEAHRQLMLKLHPDHGGSTYLAAKINQAKDLLLKS